jgi:hypothetical protein
LRTFDDAELAAEDLWGLILSAPRTQALYMPDRRPTARTLARYMSQWPAGLSEGLFDRPDADLATLELSHPIPFNR